MEKKKKNKLPQEAVKQEGEQVRFYLRMGQIQSCQCELRFESRADTTTCDKWQEHTLRNMLEYGADEKKKKIVQRKTVKHWDYMDVADKC